jgi:putative hydrolase of the HAD superfamily
MEVRRPQGIIFDYGDTVMSEESFSLLRGYSKLLEFANIGVTATAEELVGITTAIAREIDLLKRQTCLEHSLQSFFRLAFERLGISFNIGYAEMEREFWKAAVVHRPSEGLTEFLDWLESCGIKTGILSNVSFSGSVLMEDLAKHHLAHRFSFLVASSDYGIRKPNPRIFEVAIKKMGFPASEIWFVGDRLDNDIQGAIVAGLFPAWFNLRGIANQEGLPCLEFRTWQDLRERLAQCR